MNLKYLNTYFDSWNIILSTERKIPFLGANFVKLSWFNRTVEMHDFFPVNLFVTVSKK